MRTPECEKLNLEDQFVVKSTIYYLETNMRSILLLLLGVPLPIIILIALFVR